MSKTNSTRSFSHLNSNLHSELQKLRKVRKQLIESKHQQSATKLPVPQSLAIFQNVVSKKIARLQSSQITKPHEQL